MPPTPTFADALRTQDLADILGQEEVKRALKSALLVRRNAIIVGPPGIGKTTLARNVARFLPKLTVVDCGFNCLPSLPCCPACRAGKKAVATKQVSGAQRFVRVQGSPDLTAEDLIGDIDPIKALSFGPLSVEAFTPGKIFKANNGILFFDEVNRCSDKLQNALLQALEEHKVTIGGYDVDFAADFLFIGTMNPEDSSTEKLSDVFLDRFDLITMTYPESQEIEERIVEAKSVKLDGIVFPKALKTGIIAFIRQLREDKNVDKKPSVRATLGVVERAQAVALLKGQKHVTPEDIGEVIISVLSHRMSLRASVKYLEDAEEYVRDRFAQFATDHSLGGEG
jgi:magnesium chelatase subunit I